MLFIAPQQGLDWIENVRDLSLKGVWHLRGTQQLGKHVGAEGSCVKSLKITQKPTASGCLQQFLHDLRYWDDDDQHSLLVVSQPEHFPKQIHEGGLPLRLRRDVARNLSLGSKLRPASQVLRFDCGAKEEIPGQLGDLRDARRFRRRSCRGRRASACVTYQNAGEILPETTLTALTAFPGEDLLSR